MPQLEAYIGESAALFDESGNSDTNQQKMVSEKVYGIFCGLM